MKYIILFHKVMSAKVAGQNLTTTVTWQIEVEADDLIETLTDLKKQDYVVTNLTVPPAGATLKLVKQ